MTLPRLLEALTIRTVLKTGLSVIIDAFEWSDLSTDAAVSAALNAAAGAPDAAAAKSLAVTHVSNALLAAPAHLQQRRLARHNAIRLLLQQQQQAIAAGLNPTGPTPHSIYDGHWLDALAAFRARDPSRATRIHISLTTTYRSGPAPGSTLVLPELRALEPPINRIHPSTSFNRHTPSGGAAHGYGLIFGDVHVDSSGVGDTMTLGTESCDFTPHVQLLLMAGTDGDSSLKFATELVPAGTQSTLRSFAFSLTSTYRDARAVRRIRRLHGGGNHHYAWSRRAYRRTQ